VDIVEVMVDQDIVVISIKDIKKPLTEGKTLHHPKNYNDKRKPIIKPHSLKMQKS
jgi:hypothetical protein